MLKLTTDQFFRADGVSPEVFKKELAINQSIEFGLDFHKSVLGCMFKSEFIDEESKTLVLAIEVGAHFKFAPKVGEKFLNSESKTFTLPFSTACHMLTVAVGGTRGVLHAKTEGSESNNLTIPLIYPETILTEDVIFNIGDMEIL